MNSLKFNSSNSSISAAFIDSFNNRIKAKGKYIQQFLIIVSPEGKVSSTLYY